MCSAGFQDADQQAGTDQQAGVLRNGLRRCTGKSKVEEPKQRNQSRRTAVKEAYGYELEDADSYDRFG